MTDVLNFWPILTGVHRYEKSLSTRHRGQGIFIEAPILAYLIETRQGRILFDLGCDYAKIQDPAQRTRFYDNPEFPFGPPRMDEQQRLPNRLAQLGLSALDVDLVFLSHLHFDHAGGLCDFCHAEVHVHSNELIAAKEPADGAYFAEDFLGDYRWRVQQGEYDLCPGVTAIESPGHTAGHMSLWIERVRGAPILLAGDAADLQENIDDEIAPGLCWRDREDLALASLRKLKQRAQTTGAVLWPNHDMAFFQAHDCFPRETN